MALWGVTDGSESKPKNLTTDEKKEVYATASGWTREAGSIWSGNGNPDADPELLVAVSGLATKLGSADLTEIEWISTAFDVSAGGLLQLRVRFNEAVDVTGTPQLTITNDTPSRNVTASYSSGSGSNELVFAKTIGAAAADTADGDVLSVGTNAVALNGGTIKDKGTNTASTITNSSAIGTAAGTITVVA
tara:strand:+ start:1062 stop:1631 length:570 start_codon:yes stop_codon:yes gene_type:complete